uniref:Protein kinase domain-containing protein n=1 Tax=Kalanchoe fedtschenkoi TaxID=63787 RepID=A0A7N0UZZ3_KALFE
MKGVIWGHNVWIWIGVGVGVLAGVCAAFCICRIRKCSKSKSSEPGRNSSCSAPLHDHGSDSTSTIGSPRTSEWNNLSSRLAKPLRISSGSALGVPQISYKILRSATSNFTTVIGQGSFGPVYKALMGTGEMAAVKVLACDSRQGSKEFITEVLLSGRLHHRNIVNLVGYCAERGQHMLVYVYMSNGSLASHLYNEKVGPLSWCRRVSIALDVARGLEYLHHGAVPPVLHRDVKSSNILLDQSMRARVADFGLSKEEIINPGASSVRGTFGYLDPHYISTRNFTKKSDVYGFGVLLFELITSRNPLQGLMEYVELAVINTDGKVGWEEIADSRLDGDFDAQQLNDMAALAYKCINPKSKGRPSMSDLVQELTQIARKQDGSALMETWVSTPNAVYIDMSRS